MTVSVDVYYLGLGEQIDVEPTTTAAEIVNEVKRRFRVPQERKFVLVFADGSMVEGDRPVWDDVHRHGIVLGMRPLAVR